MHDRFIASTATDVASSGYSCWSVERTAASPADLRLHRQFLRSLEVLAMYIRRESEDTASLPLATSSRDRIFHADRAAARAAPSRGEPFSRYSTRIVHLEWCDRRELP